MLTRFNRYFAFAAFVFICVAIIVDFSHFINTPAIPAGKTVTYVVEPGTSLTKLAYDLNKQGFLRYPRHFIWLGKFRGASKRLQAGKYEFTGPLYPNGLLQQMLEGEVQLNRFTIIEGRTLSDMLTKLKADDDIIKEVSNLSRKQLAKKLNIKQSNPEGWFYPDTYLLPDGTTDLDVLTLSHKTMKEHLQTEWGKRAKGLPYKTPYEALIAASLVEKETAVASEKPMVAGVIVRRLKKGMKLQFDPTVIYGLGDKFDGDITRKDLRRDTPYNTYTRMGLPPTPIANPSLTSIQAALHPDDSDHLFFVANGDGSHNFSATLKGHQKNVKAYLKKLKTEKAKAKVKELEKRKK